MSYSIPMALVDLIPVLFFGAAAIVLLRDLYNKMSKGAYALFAAGGIDVFCAGFAKALYKLLYAANICNFEPLSKMFFPLQALGFLMAGIGIFCMLTLEQGSGKVYSVGAVPALFSGTMIFVCMMLAGLFFVDFSLSVLSFKMKKKSVAVLFIISFIFTLGMGYLSTKDFEKASMNWIAEGVNVVGQGTFLLGTLLLHKAGLNDFEIERKKKN